jgi:hypothetical protein
MSVIDHNYNTSLSIACVCISWVTSVLAKIFYMDTTIDLFVKLITTSMPVISTFFIYVINKDKINHFIKQAFKNDEKKRDGDNSDNTTTILLGKETSGKDSLGEGL